MHTKALTPCNFATTYVYVPTGSQSPLRMKVILYHGYHTKTCMKRFWLLGVSFITLRFGSITYSLLHYIIIIIFSFNIQSDKPQNDYRLYPVIDFAVSVSYDISKNDY